MKRIKKLLSTLLTAIVICMSLGSAISASAAEYILDPTKAKGSNYTQSAKLAQALDRIFAGDVDIFSDSNCTVETSMPIGKSMSNSTMYYVKSKTTGNKIAGWQCYIYANGVYNQLFREWVGHANGFAHSETVIGSSGGNNLTYEMLSNAKVRCGAYLRTTGNTDGSYSSNIGHSMILLVYDSKGITYLEGNGNGKGLVRITTRTWSDFNQSQLKGKNRYISHIVQPRNEIYEKMYQICEHKWYDAQGICQNCGQEFDWEKTLRVDVIGQYRVTQKTVPSVQAPYGVLVAKDRIFQPGDRLNVIGGYQNAAGQHWYACNDADGKVYYVQANCTEWIGSLPFEVVCNNFSPADHELLERKAQPVKGLVNSSYPIKRLVAYLNGKQYATWSAPNTQTFSMELRNTDINQKLSFSSLEKGKHTITIQMESFSFETPITVHESVFFMEEYPPCSHSYLSQVTLAPTCIKEGLQTDTCAGCGDQKTKTLPALGHQYTDDVCTRCGKTDLLTITGTVTSSFGTQLPTQVTLRKDSLLVTQTTIAGQSGTFSFPKLKPGSYTLEFHKQGGVPKRIELDLTVNAKLTDILICQLGDISGDNRINVGDAARLYAHVRNTNPIKDLYMLQCGDLVSDDKINIGDVGKLYGIVKE